jgi:TolB-like protein
LEAVIPSLAVTLQQALGDAYRVDRELGGGGMSRVFVAHDVALDRDVVIKVLSAESTEGVSADRFRREIQLIARLQHPHVVSILSAGTAGGSLYYMMPFVSGETLRARIAREGGLPVQSVMRILLEVLDALEFAHERGVVHRDIKPENILVSSGHSVVADFGIAKALKESGTLTSAGFALGTPTYMAPEQATADPSTDHRADLYAVGVLGYELLTGAPPFVGNPQQVITAHLTQSPASISSRRADVPAALEAVIMRALAKDPKDRPQSAREMTAAIQAVGAPRATPMGFAIPIPTRVPQRAGAATVLVLVVAAGAFMASRMRNGPETAPAPVAAGADLIAVMPLSAVSDSSLARLGQDLVVTLSTNLDGVGALHTVDAVTLLMRARKAAAPLALSDARSLARELGARSVLTGTLINEGDRVRASVALHEVGSDSAIATASALAAPRDIAAITDSLTWGILRQVWRRGTPPSPVLTGLTTKSVDALRAFLDGERHFQRLEATQALADYRRAFELDSNFVQALLRFDFVTGWGSFPPDSVTHARLFSLKDRLPDRERLWLETREARLPVPAAIARWKTLADRYPDYPPILMSAADPIIHYGPQYGIPLARARPYLDRLEQLMPEHADTRFHIAMVDMATGSSEAAAKSLTNAARVMGQPWAPVTAHMGRLYESEARGIPPPPRDSELAVVSAILAEAQRNPRGMHLTGMLGIETGVARGRLAAVEAARAAGLYTGDVELASFFGEGLLRCSRRDWVGGLRALRRAEESSLPFAQRTASAPVSVFGAWLGAVDVATADSAVRRAEAMRADDANNEDRIELRWLDGMVGLLLDDDARIERARKALLADTSVTARLTARSLAGLRLARANAEAGADSLRAVSEHAMRSGGFLMSAEAVDRFVVARALRRRGTPAEAERYLMWTDASTNVPRSLAVKISIAPLVQYERALALEEAGDREAAAFRLRRFLIAYDQPPAAHRALVEDAKRRLVQLDRTDAPARKAVAPR